MIIHDKARRDPRPKGIDHAIGPVREEVVARFDGDPDVVLLVAAENLGIGIVPVGDEGISDVEIANGESADRDPEYDPAGSRFLRRSRCRIAHVRCDRW